jgi:Arsenical resistance operon protein ArsD
MPEIHVYEPALCCTSGVCGPELDQALVTFTADAAHVNEAGGRVARHNLASDPHAFVDAESVRAFMHVAGSDGLPLTTVDGVTVLTGRYPDRSQLRRFAGLGCDGTEHDPRPPSLAADMAAPLRSLELTSVTQAACSPTASGSDSGCC